MDYTQEPTFNALVAGTEEMIRVLANAGNPDAESLVLRTLGWNNLQGHARALVPLAVWFYLKNPSHLSVIRASTTLATNMGRGSSEARAGFWRQVQRDLRSSLSADGSDRLAVGDQTRSPETAAAVARTYLPQAFGGSHRSGGAGATVLKRTLKILSHVLPG
jgi:hypothetical protein